MKKRMITSLLTIAVLSAMILPVHAEEKNTKITAEVNSTYMLTIPAETNITFNATKTPLNGPLKVTGNVKANQQVKVDVTTNDLKHIDNQENKIPYILTSDSNEFITATWTEEELRAGNKQFNLNVEIEETAWNNAKAGNYEGGIVFTANIIN